MTHASYYTKPLRHCKFYLHSALNQGITHDVAATDTIDVLFGENAFLKQLNYQTRKDQLLAQGPLNEESFQLGQTSWKNIFDQANTYSLMASVQLFKVYLQKDFKEGDDALWEDYLKSPSDFTHIVVFAPKLDKRKKITKLLQKHKLLNECPVPQLQEMNVWLQKFCKEKNLSLEPQASSVMLDYIGADIAKLYQNLEKLALFAHPEKTITLEHVQTVVLQSAGSNIFSLIDFIFEKKLTQALETLKFILQGGDHPLIILSLMLRHTRILMLCKSLRSSPPAQIAKAAAIPPFAVKKYLQQAKNIAAMDLYRIFKQLNAMDTQFKSSPISPRWQLEQMMIANFRS